MPSDVPTKPILPAAWQARTEELQELVRSGNFDVSQMPGYKRGEPPDTDVWHKTDYLDIYPKIYGRESGANGIGKLREVALTEITPNERFEVYDQDPAYFPNMGLAYTDLNTDRMAEQSLQYQAALEQHGVTVHRIRYPDPPVGAFGPQRGTWAANELLIVRGGSIVEKIAINPLGFGRAEYLAMWAFSNLGIPPIATITGTGVAETGPCFWLAEDVFVLGHGLAFNESGESQLIEAVAKSTRLTVDELHALTIRFPGDQYFYPDTGISHHPDMVLGPLDHRKVIAYPPGLDYRTWQWLKDHDFTIVEVETDEQREYAPVNVTIIEPGLVIMHEEAPNAMAAVRKAGVEVIPVPYSEFLRSGGGVHCSTLRILRDPGPWLSDPV